MRTVWFDDGIVKLIDQRYLPFEVRVYEAKTYEDVAVAIEDMVVRGSPAMGPMGVARETGRRFSVCGAGTRPRLQGARLTAWELLEAGIEHAIITDGAAGHFLGHGEIDLVLVGADRIAVNGDTANKIGTYAKAVVAKENGVPFYVAAPTSTIDIDLASGAKIPIEERSPQEVLHLDGQVIAPKESPARNPAFDVTPAKYITGIITERGILKPSQLRSSGKAAPKKKPRPKSR